MNFCLVVLGILIGQFLPGLGSSVSRQCVGVSCGDGAICVATSRLGASCKTVSTKPGLCPASPKNAECLNLRGAPLCFFDTDCSGTRKCCRGCCEQAVTQKQLDRNRLDRTRKPGVCPDTYEFVDVFWWTDLFCPDRGYIDDCQNDEECPGPDKCCPGLCGKECTRIKFDAQRPPSPTTTDATTATETTTAATTATETSTSEATTATVTETTSTAHTTVSEQATVQSNATGELNATAVENSSFNASHYANKTSDIVEGLEATDSVDIDETLSVQPSSNASALEENSTTTVDPSTTSPAQSSTTPPASATASTESADLSGTQSATETTQTTSSTTTESTTSRPQSTESTTEGRSEAQAVGS